MFSPCSFSYSRNSLKYSSMKIFFLILCFCLCLINTYSAQAEEKIVAQYKTVHKKDTDKDINICMWVLNLKSDHAPYQTSLLKSGHINPGNEEQNKSQIWVLGADQDILIERAWLEVISTFRAGQVIDTREMSIRENFGPAYVIDLPEKEFHFMMLDIGLAGYDLLIKPEGSEKPLRYSFLRPQNDENVLEYRECLNTIPKIADVEMKE